MILTTSRLQEYLKILSQKGLYFTLNLAASNIKTRFFRYVHLFKLIKSYKFNSYKLNFRDYKLFIDECRAEVNKDYSSLKKILILRLNLIQKKYLLKNIKNNSNLYDINIFNLKLQSNKKEKNVLFNFLDNWSILEVKLLCKFYQFFGSFIVSGYLRNYLKKRLMNNQNTISHVNIDALTAALEDDKPEFVINIINSKKILTKDIKTISEIEAFAYLCLNDLSKCQEIRNLFFNDNDRIIYNNFIGTNIAIIGPAKKSNEINKELESYQYVVSTNHTSSMDNGSSPINISYYACSTVLTHSNEIRKLLPSLIYACFRRSSDINKVTGKSHINKGVARIFRQSTKLMLNNYGANAIQNIIYDLGWFYPNKIKLFTTTFYASEQVYENNYINSKIDFHNLSRAIRIHEPFSNFNFIKNLAARKLIDVDEITAYYLSKSQEEYSNMLESLYGKYNSE
jgi:hypothetical protein